MSNLRPDQTWGDQLLGSLSHPVLSLGCGNGYGVSELQGSHPWSIGSLPLRVQFCPVCENAAEGQPLKNLGTSLPYLQRDREERI